MTAERLVWFVILVVVVLATTVGFRLAREAATEPTDCCRGHLRQQKRVRRAGGNGRQGGAARGLRQCRYWPQANPPP